jgi:hypothetical protein
VHVHSKLRFGTALGAALLGGWLIIVALAGAAPPAGAAPSLITITDMAGDAVVDGSANLVSEARGDIVAASAEYRADRIALSVRTASLVDPLQDPSWATDFTYLSWQLDTTGDGRPDYEVQYFTRAGKLTGDVTPTGQGSAKRCDLSAATFDAVTGYQAVIDPNCLGNPSGFSYKVTVFYEQDPTNPDSDVATDVTPDQGLSPLVTRSGSVAPLGATPATPGTPLPAPVSGAPTAAAPHPSAASPAPPTASAGASTSPTASSSPTASAAPAQLDVLPRTGPVHTRRLAALGAGLLGLGLSLRLFPTRHRPRPIG